MQRGKGEQQRYWKTTSNKSILGLIWRSSCYTGRCNNPGVIESGQARSEDSSPSLQEQSVEFDESDQESESDAIGESDSESSPSSVERRAKWKRLKKETSEFK